MRYVVRGAGTPSILVRFLFCRYSLSPASVFDSAQRSSVSRCSTSRITGTANNGKKRLWVAAIDQSPKPGTDPSHAAFHLTGQDEKNLAMRGFMSLPPCAGNGRGCTSGTDCCGGYCAPGADGGAAMCQSMPSGCSQNGDKCNVNGDCCNAASGVTCIAHVCSEPTPQ